MKYPDFPLLPSSHLRPVSGKPTRSPRAGSSGDQRTQPTVSGYKAGHRNLFVFLFLTGKSKTQDEFLSKDITAGNS